jgi:hypothetical protein
MSVVFFVLTFVCGTGSGWIIRDTQQERDVRPCSESNLTDGSQDITIWSVGNNDERMRKFRPNAVTITRNDVPVTTRWQSQDPQKPVWIIKIGEQESGGVQIFASEIAPSHE